MLHATRSFFSPALSARQPVTALSRNLSRHGTRVPLLSNQQRVTHTVGKLARQPAHPIQQPFTSSVPGITMPAFHEADGHPHPIHYFGAPREGSAHGLEPQYVLARALQRHPNARVRGNLNLLHTRMGEKFIGMSDEALEWLLGGSRNTCRGGLVNAAELRAFLNTNPNDLPSAQLISQLESLVSAIAFRVSSNPAQELPIQPETPAQKEMYDAIREITDGQLVRSINRVYTQRAADRMPGDHNRIVCEQDVDLSDDEDDVFRGQPNNRIPPGQFKLMSDNGKPSWVFEAKLQGIEVINHVSGTTPLAISVAMGLLRGASEQHAAILENENEAREFCTALLMPKFLRSNYHSLAETQAGIEHFFAERYQRQSVVISPKEAEQRAYQAMSQAACNDNQFMGVTPQEAITHFCTSLEMAFGSAPFLSGEICPLSDSMMITTQRQAVLQRADTPKVGANS